MGFQSYLFCDLNIHQFTTLRKKQGQEGEMSVSEEHEFKYPSFKETMDRTFNRPDIESKGCKRWLKGIDPIYFGVNILWKYYLEHKRYPDVAKDKKSLLNCRKTYLTEHELDPRIISEDAVL
jgi:ubiquitin-like 1-activating enzyme E1 A